MSAPPPKSSLPTSPLPGAASGATSGRIPALLRRIWRRNSPRAALGLLLAAVILFAGNIAADRALNGIRLDLTERGLYTISDSTRAVIDAMAEPVVARLFFSDALGESSPDHATHFARVRDLLEQYAALSGGRIRIIRRNPAPYTRDEDAAVAYGLQSVPVNAAGDAGYFGLVATNSTDDKAVVPFFSLDRETLLEYDLTKVFDNLNNPVKRVVGMISTLPVLGRHAPPFGASPRWLSMDSLGQVFDIHPLDAETRAIPEEIELLILVHPNGLAHQTLYAIDQFALSGRPVLAFVDPLAEAGAAGAWRGATTGAADVNHLLRQWGIALVPGMVAADIDIARRVNVQNEGRLQPVDYVVWLALTRANFLPGEAATEEMSLINMATPGILQRLSAPGSSTAQGSGPAVAPLIVTGPRSMRINAARVAVQNPDAVGLFRDFKPSGERLVLAARISGSTTSAYADGPPPGATPGGVLASGTGQESGRESGHRRTGSITAIVVADTDMLHDRFWAERRDYRGNAAIAPFANNADFLVGTVDLLLGGATLAELRGRGKSDRPFDRVETIRREAERKYRARERELVREIQEIQIRIEEFVDRGGAGFGHAVPSTRETAEITRLRARAVAMREGLREVQRALRADIDWLDAWLKFFNIGAVPLLLALVALAVGLGRRFAGTVRRRSRSTAPTRGAA